jgi:PIN domain nuclease of toxin-antitoxin system
MNVLDSSALLTWFKDEPGAETVEACLPGGLLTSLAIGETVDHLVRLIGAEPEGVAVAIAELPSPVLDLDVGTALQAAFLRAHHYHRRTRRVSLVDCSLAAVARRVGGAIVSSDRHLLDLCAEEGIDVVALPDSAGAVWEPSAGE